MAEPGWYEDPHRGGGRRWWDGQRWSEHVIPPPPTSPPGVVPPPPGGPPAGTSQGGPAGPAFVPAPDDLTPAMRPTATTPSAPGRPTPSAAGGRSSRLLPVLLGLLALVAIGGVVAFLLWGDDDAAEPPPVTGTVTAGEERSFTVADDGEWELVVEVPAGLLVIDARGVDGFDPVVTLVGDDGRELARNDDRSSQQQERYGGGTFDALIAQEVPAAGRYRIVVTGFAGQGGAGQVSFPVVGG